MGSRAKVYGACLVILFILTGCTGQHQPAITPVPTQDNNQSSVNQKIQTPGQAKRDVSEIDTFLIKRGAAARDIEYHDPESIAVLVNKQNSLPADYVPSDLREVNIPFIFSEKSEKRLMRKEAAENLEKLFAAAKKENLFLYGVSGYRSYNTQKYLFSNNTKRFGSEEKANMISARPGESEHQTGLAMDVTSERAGFGLNESFADTPEFTWLKENAHNYGFIIRYPKEKEHITGYSYEPWHLRYVGREIAEKLLKYKITYEEYLFII